MLFNSPEFLFGFLPIVLIVHLTLQRLNLRRYQAHFLLIASVFFYGWWSISYISLLALSITVNYTFGRLLAERPRQWLLLFAIAVDIGLLSYFKYADFGIETLNSIFGLNEGLAGTILPLGISFYTFTQIAYLVDAYRGGVVDRDPVRYGLFVTFFPHLIAGPILHHEEMTRQFRRFVVSWVEPADFAIGITTFAIGLFKKTVLADGYAPIVSATFSAAANGGSVDSVSAWCSVLAYTLQLYFDFSGYTDMAIGLARMIGILMPQNFNSPYKSASIAEFWTRWHMTLSRFLRDYLYIPLGGNRRGAMRSYANVMVTMLLGGLWHGAGWTFVLWGGLHGLYLIIGRLWARWADPRRIFLPRAISVAFTFFLVMLAWVPFRSANFSATKTMFKSMLFVSSPSGEYPSARVIFGLMAGLAIVWFAPNSQQIFFRYGPVLSYAPVPPNHLMEWRLTPTFAAALAMLIVATVLFNHQVSEFLYFQF